MLNTYSKTISVQILDYYVKHKNLTSIQIDLNTLKKIIKNHKQQKEFKDFTNSGIQYNILPLNIIKVTNQQYGRWDIGLTTLSHLRKVYFLECLKMLLNFMLMRNINKWRIKWIFLKN